MNDNSMLTQSAFLLAAGMGTRLKPYTDHCPKPLVKIHGRPILSHTMDNLVKAGVKDVVINVHHHPTLMQDFIKQGHAGLSLTASIETELLETGGGLKKGLSLIKDDVFFIVNGDAYIENNEQAPAYADLIKHWRADMDILLLLQDIKTMKLTAGIGDYFIDESGKAKRAKNKDGTHMFTGIRLAHKRIFEGAPEGAFSFLKLMDEAEAKGRLYALAHQGIYHHISTPQDLEGVNAA